MARKPSHRQALSVLKHLPGYLTIFGWNRGRLAKALMSWFIAPGKDDDSRKAQNKRAFIASFRLDEPARGITPYYNREPWISAAQQIVNFDRLLEFSVQLGINPFKDLDKHIDGLSIGMWGNWIGGLRAPSPHIQEALDRFFVQRLGPRHHVFHVHSDYMLLKLGYLTDKHLADKQSHGGDRSLPGGDPSLRFTSMIASAPIFQYSEKSVRWGPWDEPNYVIKLDTTKQKYVRKSYYFGVRRYERLALVRKMAGHLEIVDRYKNTLQETW